MNNKMINERIRKTESELPFKQLRNDNDMSGVSLGAILLVIPQFLLPNLWNWWIAHEIYRMIRA